jgi:hypothetical protein
MFRFVNYVTAISILLACSILGNAQRGREVYTGTIVSYGSGFNTRVTTGTFTLTIDRYTSDERARRLLGLLQEGADEGLVRQLDDEDVGSFSVNGRIGPRVNVVRESMVDGKRRIFAVFRRWTHFAELRGGYRSLDYPYGVIEMYLDPETGRGEGTYVAAAKVRWRQDKKTGQYQIEIENFATYPARLMGIRQHGRVAS